MGLGVFNVGLGGGTCASEERSRNRPRSGPYLPRGTQTSTCETPRSRAFLPEALRCLLARPPSCRPRNSRGTRGGHQKTKKKSAHLHSPAVATFPSISSDISCFFFVFRLKISDLKRSLFSRRNFVEKQKFHQKKVNGRRPLRLARTKGD